MLTPAATAITGLFMSACGELFARPSANLFGSGMPYDSA
jgi:hypothetical protein